MSERTEAAHNAAIYFHPDGYVTGGPKLMGRQAAGEGFLQGFLRHSGVERFYCLAPNHRTARVFAEIVSRHRPDKPPADWIAPIHLQRVSEPGCLYVPGPGLGEFAWRRRAGDQRAFSIMGLTHTTASERAMDEISAVLSAPVQPWDALVCTSEAVRDSLQILLGDWRRYLADRHGAREFPLPQMPVIPLGVDCDQLEIPAHRRIAWRAKLGIQDDEVAILFLGRLSFHAKANPYPMYVALEETARRTGRKLVLIQAGWFANEAIERAFRIGAETLCPSVRAIYADGRDREVRDNIRAAADIFSSLSDNIQETFGLTPLEAMAAGLPVVASDWDGYKGTVRHGEDGFLIPTIMPSQPDGADLAARFEWEADDYDKYIGNSALFVAVDVNASIEAFTRLVQEPDLRRRMGESGRVRAREKFDWKVIIGQYQALWGELAALRSSAAISVERGEDMPANPSRMDPFRLFAGYPTAVLARGDRLELNIGNAEEAVRRLGVARSLWMVNYAGDLLPSDDECRAVLVAVADHPGMALADLLSNLPQPRRRIVRRGIVWLLKLGLLKRQSLQ